MYWFICSPCTIVPYLLGSVIAMYGPLRYPGRDPVFPPKNSWLVEIGMIPWIPRIPDPMGKRFGVDDLDFLGLHSILIGSDWFRRVRKIQSL